MARCFAQQQTVNARRNPTASLGKSGYAALTRPTPLDEPDLIDTVRDYLELLETF